MTQLRIPALRLALGAIAVPMVMLATLAGSVPASASGPGCQSWTASQPPSPGSVDSRLRGVVVLSPCSAWAVGSQTGTGPSQTLIEHWNGAAWSVATSPHPGHGVSLLNGIAASSPSSVWAVGRFTDDAGQDRTLIEHWNGTIWSVVPSPGPAGSELTGIRVVSAHDAWAVGDVFDGTQSRNLILRWNGSAWKQTASPDPGSPAASDVLAAVSSTSGTSAWAVGESTDGAATRTVVLHWNGSSWSQVASPGPGIRNALYAVAATSATNAWAVGITTSSGGTSSALILRWNGAKWTRSPGPAGGLGAGSFLAGLAATSSSSALAVGAQGSGGSAEQTLVLRFDGSAWHVVPSPSPGASGATLYAAAVSAAGSTWAVGIYRTGLAGQALAVHCC